MSLEAGKERGDVSKSVSIPPLFRCPISLELMTDPVILSTGISYHRVSIEKWMDDGNNVCPVTLEVLRSKELIPNHTLCRLIHEWCLANSCNDLIGIPKPEPLEEPRKPRQIIRDVEDASADKLGALKNLRSLTRVSERKRQVLQSEGALPVLIQVLDSEASLNSEIGADREAVEEAIVGISLFSVEAICNRRDFMRPSVLAALEWVLAKCSLEARMNAASIVEKMSHDRNAAREIGTKEGIIDGLLKLFGENLYPSAINVSLKALLPFCTMTENRGKIAKAGVVPRLIELLPAADVDTAEQSLAFLEALSTISEGRSAIVGHALAVPTIVRSVLAVSDAGTNYAVGILLKVCFNSEEEPLTEFLQMGTLERLLFLLQMGCSPRTKQKVNELLRLLSPIHRNSSCNDFYTLEL